MLTVLQGTVQGGAQAHGFTLRNKLIFEKTNRCPARCIVPINSYSFLARCAGVTHQKSLRSAITDFSTLWETRDRLNKIPVDQEYASYKMAVKASHPSALFPHVLNMICGSEYGFKTGKLEAADLMDDDDFLIAWQDAVSSCCAVGNKAGSSNDNILPNHFNSDISVDRGKLRNVDIIDSRLGARGHIHIEWDTKLKPIVSEVIAQMLGGGSSFGSGGPGMGLFTALFKQCLPIYGVEVASASVSPERMQPTITLGGDRNALDSLYTHHIPGILHRFSRGEFSAFEYNSAVHKTQLRLQKTSIEEDANNACFRLSSAPERLSQLCRLKRDDIMMGFGELAQREPNFLRLSSTPW